MKYFYSLTLLLALCVAKTQAQDYQTIYPERISYFSDSHSEITPLRIDSVSNSTNLHLFPFNTIEALNTGGCASPNSGSWIGKQVIIQPNGVNLFFNRNNELITINTQAQVQDTWRAFTASDSSYVMATVVSHNNEEFLGITDSVKTISLQAFYKNQTPKNGNINNYNIKISKQHGFIQTVNFHYFPDLEAGFPFDGINQFTLFNIDLPNASSINFTWFQAYDFNVGDELHIVASENDQYRAITENEIRTYLTRINYPDSIVYQHASQKQIIVDTIAPNVSNTITYSQDTLTEVIVQNLAFNTYPKEPVFYNNMVGFYGMKFDEDFLYKSYPDPNWEFWKMNQEDSCWTESVFDGCTDLGSYIKGLGGPYFYCDVWTVDKWGRQLVYYKKGNDTWGDSLNLTAIQEVDAFNMEVNVYPNPAKDRVQIQFEKTPNAPFTFELYHILGKLVNSTPITRNNQTIDVSDLSAGVYVYQLKQNQTVVRTNKLIVE